MGVEDLPDHAHAGELALRRALAAGDLERVEAALAEGRNRTQAAGTEGTGEGLITLCYNE